jgi:MoxR-like ATPase
MPLDQSERSRRAVPGYEGAAEAAERIIQNAAKVIIGKRESIELALVAVLAGGHALFEDVPGVGKTLLAKSLARSIEADFRRIQFTPDLLPSDVTGLNVYDRGRSAFEFWAGPVFANVVLADEINRASPKTQSALLEAMGEAAVTVDGETRALPQPFCIIATQNPVEHTGTYPLPHAELDRFMIKMDLGYPGAASEVELLRLSGDPVSSLSPVVSLEEFAQLTGLVREVSVSEPVLRYVVGVTSATREHEGAALGASPRASRMLLAASKARAALRGRAHCVPEDVAAPAPNVLAHRILPVSRRRGADLDGAGSIVQDALDSVRATGEPE